MKSLRIMVLAQEDLIPPTSLRGIPESKSKRFRTEFDVISTLREIGHEVRPVGVLRDLSVLRQAVDDFCPDVVFNLVEEFHGSALYDQHVVSFLELAEQPYTGCNPRGLMVSHDKALQKKILNFHGILVPNFDVYPIGRLVKKDDHLPFPLIVKSQIEEGSVGISQASIVYTEIELRRRVKFIHERVKSDAIAEEYVEGRDIYVALLGNEKLHVFPALELVIEHLPDGAKPIATDRVKWNARYQKRCGVKTQAATLPIKLTREIEELSKQIYRTLGLTGYARIDFRLSEDGRPYFLEANPNPNIAQAEDFAVAAKHVGITYDELLQKIVNLGIRYSEAA